MSTDVTRVQTPGRATGVRIDSVVTAGTFSLDGGTWDVENNVYVIGDDHECLVIDAAHDAGPILQAVAGRTVKAILLTHGHDDHIGAVRELKEATGAPVHLRPDTQRPRRRGQGRHHVEPVRSEIEEHEVIHLPEGRHARNHEIMGPAHLEVRADDVANDPSRHDGTHGCEMRGPSTILVDRERHPSSPRFPGEFMAVRQIVDRGIGIAYLLHDIGKLWSYADAAQRQV